MWTPWFIRFVFEKGWYSLYTNLPNREAFAVSYREAGLNFNDTRGPMNVLVSKLDPNIHFSFQKNLHVFDYHMRLVADPTLLNVRSKLWHKNQLTDQCMIGNADDIHTQEEPIVGPIQGIPETRITESPAVEILDRKEYAKANDPISIIDLKILTAFQLIFLFFMIIFILKRKSRSKTLSLGCMKRRSHK